MTIDFESDAQLDALSADKLSLVSKLALQQQGLELQIAETEAALKRLQAQLRTVTEEQLPEAMAELGITELVLSDGSHITVVNEYYASIPRAMEQRAFRWLADRNFDSLLKHSFTLQFGRGVGFDGEQMQAGQAVAGRRVPARLSVEHARQCFRRDAKGTAGRSRVDTELLAKLGWQWRPRCEVLPGFRIGVGVWRGPCTV